MKGIALCGQHRFIDAIKTLKIAERLSNGDNDKQRSLQEQIKWLRKCASLSVGPIPVEGPKKICASDQQSLASTRQSTKVETQSNLSSASSLSFMSEFNSSQTLRPLIFRWGKRAAFLMLLVVMTILLASRRKQRLLKRMLKAIRY